MTSAVRLIRVAAVCALAFLAATCRDQDTTGPGRLAHASLDLAALTGAGSPGQPDIPLDSVRVTMRRTPGGTLVLDTIVHVRGDTVSGDSLVLRLSVALERSPERVAIDILTYGAGLVWYEATDSTTLAAGTAASPAITAKYVGPGANAARVAVAPVDTTVVGGATMGLRAVVYDSSNAPIAGVPVGWRLSDTTRGAIANPTYLTATFTAAGAVRDSVWLVGETPTHLRDSTRVHVVPPPAALAKSAGDSQSVVIGTAAPAPLAVRVVDVLGGGFQGDTVSWSVVAGSAALSAAKVVSDSAGHAGVTVTPTAVGTIRVTAAAPGGLTGSPVTFTVTGKPGTPVAIAAVSGNAQTDSAGSALPAPFVVKVTDSAGNAVPGATVAFDQVFGPRGAPAADTGLTDASGLRQITFTLSDSAGADSIRASLVGHAATATFTATGVPGGPFAVIADSGANQSATPNVTLAQPLVARVTDRFGNPIPAVAVTWAIRAGGGSLSAATATSDAAGRTRVTYTLGPTPGADTVRASVAGGAHADFAATTLTVAVATVTLDRTSDTVAAGAAVTYHATLKDSLGNVVAAPVAWTTSDSTVAAIVATTADSNTATAGAGGVTSIVATAGGRADTALLYVRAPAAIAALSGDAQTDTVGKTLAQPLVALVTDQFGAPAKGAKVVFSLAAGHAGAFAPDTAVSDSLGHAQTAFTLSDTAGADSVRAALLGTAASAAFTVTALPGAPAALVADSGAAQTDTVGRTLAGALVARLTDRFGNPVPGDTLLWTVRVGSGTLSAPSTVTDAGGRGRVTFTLGTVPGADTVRASRLALAADFAATALAGAPASVTLDRTVDTIPAAGTRAYHVAVQDAFGNSLATPVTWTSSAPGIASLPATTADSNTATGVAGGVTSIVAAAGGLADTALLYVRALTTVGVTPADTVITAVGDSVRLRAAALDNFGDTVTANVVLRYSSAAPTVVTVNATTGLAHLVGAGNGVVVVTDTVSKKQGTATLRVNQAVAAIVNAPADSLEVGVGAQGQIVATAKDRNGFTIAGKTFGWTSRNGQFFTVSPSGVVTGLAIGQAYVIDTLVDSATVYRDSTLISVVASPPAKLAWAFDSIAIGNGGSAQLGLTLTRLSATALGIRIVSSDTTKVKPSQSVISIAANTASGSVTLNGLAATSLGPVTVVAQDTAGVYAPDTITVAVVSTASFAAIGQFSRLSDIYVNQNETYSGQVLLSDPAPPGGLGITFTYGKSLSSVTPSPVIVPAGQLTAPVTITGVAAGTDSVVPATGGYVGKYSYVHVAPDSLRYNAQYPYNGLVGLGQALPNPSVSITYSMDHILPLTLVTSTGRVTTPAADTIRASQTLAYFPVSGAGLGADTVTISAPNWVPVRAPFVVTTPHVGTNGTQSVIAGNPSLAYWYAYAEDSLGTAHNVVDTLVVTAVSRDTSVVVMDTSVARILPGNSSALTYGFHAQSSAGGDSTWIVLTAPGYTPDSFKVLVTKPTLTVSLSYPYDGRVSLNTAFPTPLYVSIPYARPDTFWVRFTHANGAAVGHGATDSLRVLPGQTVSYAGQTAYGYLDTLKGMSLGVDTMTISAPGYVTSGGNVANDGRVVWTVGPLRTRIQSAPTSLVTISPPQIASVSVIDSVDGLSRNLLTPLPVTLTSSNPSALTVDSGTITIPAGTYYRYDTLRVVGMDTSGTLRLHLSAAGLAPDSSNVIRITPTALAINPGYPYAFQPGYRLRQPSNYVSLPAAAPAQVKVALTHRTAGVDSLTTDTVVIAAGQSISGYFDMIGLDSIGTDTIFASAPGFVTAAKPVAGTGAWNRISSIGTSHLTTDPDYRGSVYLQNRNQITQRPVVPETLTVVSSNPAVLLLDSALAVNGTGDTALVLVDSSAAAGAYGYYRVRFVGGGTAYLKVFTARGGNFVDSTATITVTGPSLNFALTNVALGQGQEQYQYVYVNNPVASDLWIHLARSDSLQSPALQAFQLTQDSVKIPAGGTASYAFAYDTIVGNVAGASANLIARAPGYTQAVTPVQVNVPRLATSTATLNLSVGQAPYTAYTITEEQAGQSRPSHTALVVTDSSTDATVTVSDSASATTPAHTYYAYFPVRGLKKGSAAIVFRAPGYTPDTMVVQVDTGTLAINAAPSGLGVGQVSANGYVSLPFTVAAPLVVSLASSNPAVFTVPATVTIPAGQSSASFAVTGVSAGTANISATSSLTHAATPVAVKITTPTFLVQAPASVAANTKYTVYVYAKDSLGNTQNVAAPLTVTLVSSDPAHTTFDSSTVTIPAGSYYSYTGVTFTQGGGATYTITASAAGYTSASSATVTAAAPPAPVTGAAGSAAAGGGGRR